MTLLLLSSCATDAGDQSASTQPCPISDAFAVDAELYDISRYAPEDNPIDRDLGLLMLNTLPADAYDGVAPEFAGLWRAELRHIAQMMGEADSYAAWDKRAEDIYNQQLAARKSIQGSTGASYVASGMLYRAGVYEYIKHYEEQFGAYEYGYTYGLYPVINALCAAQIYGGSGFKGAPDDHTATLALQYLLFNGYVGQLSPDGDAYAFSGMEGLSALDAVYKRVFAEGGYTAPNSPPEGVTAHGQDIAIAPRVGHTPIAYITGFAKENDTLNVEIILWYKNAEGLEYEFGSVDIAFRRADGVWRAASLEATVADSAANE